MEPLGACVSKAALLGAIPPFLLNSSDNPEGVDRSVFDAIKAAVIADRPAYFKDFLDNFYNVDQYLAGASASGRGRTARSGRSARPRSPSTPASTPG